MAKLRIAVQGCCHGELVNVYKTVSRMHSNKKIDLLIILGDFQSIRNQEDLKSISIPPKYLKMGDFHKYYNNELVAPVPTIFIGGNHESMRHLMQLPYGGYVANNIFYLGFSNVIWYRGIRIGSLSGIWKEWDLDRSRFSWDALERQNWSKNIKSLYHVRKSDLIPLFMLDHSKKMDIMLSHDWPTDAVYYGDIEELLRRKPFFKKDIDNRELGSPINSELLNNLKPVWWLSAHLHVKFSALIKHDIPTNKETKNNDEIELDLDDSDDDNEVINDNGSDVNKETHFLALDKCLPRRQWLEIIEVETNDKHPSFVNNGMYWDPEFINNLHYMEKHRDQLTSKRFSEFNWNQLNHEKDKVSLDKVLDDMELYQIPNYERNIQFKELEQTKLFKERFLINN